MAASIPLEEGRNLILNHLVTEVHYDQPGDLPVRVVSQDQRTGRRTIFRAKWVVVTFSAGVLQSDLLTFSPPLPRWKSEVLHMLRQSEALQCSEIQMLTPALLCHNETAQGMQKVPIIMPYKHTERHKIPPNLHVLRCVVME